jgi:hypothetical protein
LGREFNRTRFVSRINCGEVLDVGTRSVRIHSPDDADGASAASVDISRGGRTSGAGEHHRLGVGAETHPSRSGDHPVLMNQAAQTICSSQIGELWIDDLCWI